MTIGWRRSKPEKDGACDGIEEVRLDAPEIRRGLEVNRRGHARKCVETDSPIAGSFLPRKSLFDAPVATNTSIELIAARDLYRDQEFVADY